MASVHPKIFKKIDHVGITKTNIHFFSRMATLFLGEIIFSIADQTIFENHPGPISKIAFWGVVAGAEHLGGYYVATRSFSDNKVCHENNLHFFVIFKKS